VGGERRQPGVVEFRQDLAVCGADAVREEVGEGVQVGADGEDEVGGAGVLSAQCVGDEAGDTAGCGALRTEGVTPLADADIGGRTIVGGGSAIGNFPAHQAIPSLGKRAEPCSYRGNNSNWPSSVPAALAAAGRGAGRA
jgi:hypothetical protein